MTPIYTLSLAVTRSSQFGPASLDRSTELAEDECYFKESKEIFRDLGALFFLSFAGLIVSLVIHQFVLSLCRATLAG